MLMRGIVLAIVSLVIVFAGIISTSAEETTIPEWVKSTLVMWSKGEISDQEFVTAIDYLKDKGIVKLSSVNDEEVQRQIAYLQAKNEVIRKEVEDLRKTNEEYRISLKSQEINKGSTSTSSVLREYDALQKEVKTLRETNRQFGDQISSFLNNKETTNNKVSGNINDENKILQIESDYVKKLNELKQETQDDKNKIDELQSKTLKYEQDIKLLKIENENKNNALKSLKSENQANRDDINQLTKGNESFDSLFTNIRTENLEQKKKLVEYENAIKTFDSNFDVLNKKQSNMKEEISALKQENSKYQNAINNMEGLNQEQKNILIANAKDLEATKKNLSTLDQKIKNYESSILSLEAKNKEYQGKITQTEIEKSEYKEKINQLEAKNSEQQKTLVNLTKEFQKSDEFTTSISSEFKNFKNSIKILEDENKQYESKITELEDKNNKKDSSIVSLNKDHGVLNDLVKSLNSKITTYENTIKVLENKEESKQSSVTGAQMQIDKSNKNVDTLKSKITDYEKQIKNLQSENKDSKNSLKLVTNEMSENYNLIKELNQEKDDYEKRLEVLKKENKILSNQSQLIGNKNTDKESSMTKISSENEELKKQISSLQLEIKQKHQEINFLNTHQGKESIKTFVIQPPVPTLQYDNNSRELDEVKKQSDRYLVEVNYLKAKNIVIDEEIETLRGENEEYRILINLLKKGENSQTGVASTNHDNISPKKGGGVVMYKTVDDVKQIPKDWINKIDSTKKYSIYVESVPKWSSDVSGEVSSALKFWKDASGVSFDLVNTPDADTVIISWKKTLTSNYDGYTTNRKQVDISLGSYGCDKNWRAYDSKSVRDILIHEIGHVLDLEHSSDKSNIMYPMIYSGKFASVDTTITIGTKESAFIKTCSFSAEPAYKYTVKAQDITKKFDLFFVPSDAEKQTFDAGKQFDYYSNINCIGLSKSAQSGTCENVADTGGLLIVNSENNEKITISVHIEEK